MNETARYVSQHTGKQGLNCLVNNAGVSIGCGINRVTTQKMIDNYSVNVVGPLMLTKVFRC